jgi:hypothetical protein
MSSTDIKPHEEILLWSHYAAKHSGVRIKLNLNEKGTSPCFIRKVVYATERVGLDLTNGAETESVRRSIIEAASTKAEGWRYEAEYRLFTIPGACKIECGPDGVTRSFLEVPAEVFIGVDFGINCPQEIISQISILMKSKYPDARLRKAKQNKSNFLIDYHDL